MRGVVLDAMANRNVEIVERIFGKPGAGFRPIDGGTFLESFAPDGSYTVIGTAPFSGRYEGRDDILARLVMPLMAALDGGVAMAVDSVFGDGDRVAMQSRGQARSKDGRPYENTYCLVFRFCDGRIVELTEYLDTDLVRRTFG